MKEMVYTLVAFFVILLGGCEPPPTPQPTATPGGNMAYRDSVLSTRLSAMIAYYEMNGNLDDSGPNGLTGATGTNVIYSLDGVGSTQAAVFDGVSSYIDLGANFRAEIDALDMDSFTILLWLAARDDTIWVESNLKTVYSMIAGSDFLDVYKPLLGRQLAAAFLDGTHVIAGGVVPAGADFYMVALTLDSAAGVGRVYINDNLINEAAYGGGAWTDALSSSEVGRRGAGNYWDGKIDELTVWGEALSVEEIVSLYHAGAAEYAPVMPLVGTHAVMQIFDRAGTPIGELNPLIDFVSWRRNSIGQATFSIAKSDPKANDTYLRAQNRALILFDNGLPPWGGIMQPDFTVEQDRITAKLLTAEVLLRGRITDRGRYFTDATVGEMVVALISEANAVAPTGLTIGSVWEGGNRHSPEYHFKSLLRIFQESLFRRLADADFYVTPVVGDNGRLSFSLHTAERRGRNLTGVALHQGLNMTGNSQISYQGPVINRWVVVGDGDGWGGDRLVAVAEDLDSQQRYGLLESSEIHQGITNPQTLQTIADNLLAQTAVPRVILDITAVNLPPARFSQYDIGDVLAVEMPDYGIGSAYVGAASVEARAFYPADGRLNLVLMATEGA